MQNINDDLRITRNSGNLEVSMRVVSEEVAVTLGLSRTGVYGESKVIRLLSIIHNGIILDLVCGFRW